jgi:hypothetical protein
MRRNAIISSFVTRMISDNSPDERPVGEEPRPVGITWILRHALAPCDRRILALCDRLFGVGATDLATFLAAPAVLLAISSLAC